MAINTNDVVTNIVSGIESINNGSIVTTCLRTGRYNTVVGSDGSDTYSLLNTKSTNRFGNIAYYNKDVDSYTTTTTAAPTIPTWGVANSEILANPFTGAGTYATPFTSPSIRYPATSVWGSIQILSNSYIKFSWTAMNLGDCTYDAFGIELSTSGNVSTAGVNQYVTYSNCAAQNPALVVPITSGQYFVLQPDSNATFTNLKIWLSNTAGIDD